MASRKSTKAPDPMPSHVLVVEDDAVLGLAIEHALEDAGVKTVEICTSTDEALAALRKASPQVIILDVHLADRDDGWAIAELVAAIGPDAPRIVFSTGKPSDIPEDIAAMGSVLEKPYETDTLVSLLREPRKSGILARLRGR